MSSFNRQWMEKFNWPVDCLPYLPLCIAHRGASDYRIENSMAAFELASDLCADMWEIDIRMSVDEKVIVSHDDNLARLTGRGIRVSQSRWDEIDSISLRGGHSIPTLEETVCAARKRGAGLYIEVKSEGAAVAAWLILRQMNFQFAVIGSFNPLWIAELREQGCDYPLSVLIPCGADPFSYGRAAEPDILHLCWRDASAVPQNSVTDELLGRAHAENRAVLLWHEDRREVLDDLESLPVLGICTNRPECLRPVPRNSEHCPAIVAHRGMKAAAPENTRESARICIDQRLAFVEIDVRTTADNELIVIHDATLDRTTNGTGKVTDNTLAQIKELDAGSWFSPEFSGMRVPTLGEILELAAGKIGVYIEIKDADPEGILAEVRRSDSLHDVFFWCHDIEALRYIRRTAPGARLMAARWMYSSLDEAVSDYDADIVEYEYGRDDLDELDACRQRNVQSMVFSLTSRPDELNTIIDAKPDLLNMGSPDLAKIIMHYPKYSERNFNQETRFAPQ